MSEKPLKFESTSLAEAHFDDVNLQLAKFVDVNLKGASFSNVSLVGAEFKDVNFSCVTIAESNIDGMKINGVLVSELLLAYQQRAEK